MEGLLPLLAGAGFMLYGIYMLFDSKKMLRDIDESSSWPQVKGKVLRNELVSYRSDRPDHDVNLLYEYEVDGKTYKGNLLFLYTLTKKKEAEDIVARFPEGEVVDVFYKPGQPKKAILITGGRGEKKYHEIIMSLISILIGMGVCVIGINKM